MKIHQISLFAENKPGRIAASARLLAAEKIDLHSLFLADAGPFGVMRLIASDWRRAVEVLEAGGFVVKVTEVLAVEVPDEPGGLATVLEALDGAGINIEYMYAFPVAKDGKAVLIFRFDSPGEAIARLQAKGINVLAGDELLK